MMERERERFFKHYTLTAILMIPKILYDEEENRKTKLICTLLLRNSKCLTSDGKLSGILDSLSRETDLVPLVVGP